MVMFSHRIQDQPSVRMQGVVLCCWCFERDWFFLVLVMLRSDDVRPPLADVLQVRNVIILTF